MTKEQIKTFLQSFALRRGRVLCIVDFGNVEKWRHSLGWKIGIKKLAELVKHLAEGNKANRRFYYGADYGQSERNTQLLDWSRAILEKAQWNRFEVVTKRVKYIHSSDNKYGFEKKCDLDVEMAIDLVKYRDAYDTVVLFSGDGDLMYAIRYLKEEYGKSCIVVGARDHIGREVFDARTEGYIEAIIFAQDLEYRLKE